MTQVLDQFVAPDGSWVRRDVITDPEVYRQELRRIFASAWLVVAHESQIPNTGDFVASLMGEDPVIVVRGRSGDVDVLLNTCSHRASRVCRADQGTANGFTCPNHGWQYGIDGRLLGIPQIMKGYAGILERSELGLLRARVTTWCGLVFATFDPDLEDLETYLGDAVYYLETVFGRYEHGMEMLGSQRAVVPCNWKLAAENLGTDLQHPEIAHGAFMELWPDPVMEFMMESEQILTSMGHPICIGRRPPPYTEEETILAAIGDSADRREVVEWLETTNRWAAKHLGVERAGMYVYTGSVFPNLSFLPGISAVFLCHPRGPCEMEWWTWCLVAADAPVAMRRARRTMAMMTGGPGGLILAEDAENWADMTRATSGVVSGARPLHIGRGLGEEYLDDQMPGVFAPMRSEHAMRGFWLNWRRAMLREA